MGRATKNREFVAAIRRIIPDAEIELPEGFDPRGSGRVFELDPACIREDAPATSPSTTSSGESPTMSHDFVRETRSRVYYPETHQLPVPLGGSGSLEKSAVKGPKPSRL